MRVHELVCEYMRIFCCHRTSVYLCVLKCALCACSWMYVFVCACVLCGCVYILEHRGETTCVLDAVATFNSAVVSATICVTFATTITATSASASIVSAVIDDTIAVAFATVRVCATESDPSPLWNVLLKDHQVVLRSKHTTSEQYSMNWESFEKSCTSSCTVQFDLGVRRQDTLVLIPVSNVNHCI